MKPAPDISRKVLDHALALAAREVNQGTIPSKAMDAAGLAAWFLFGGEKKSARKP